MVECSLNGKAVGRAAMMCIGRLAVMAIVSACTLSLPVRAAEILTFEFSALAGSEATADSNSNDPNLGSSTISRGAGLTASANGGRFNATSWALTSIANAVSGNDYMEFTITPNAGYQFTVTNIYIQLQRSGTGPRGIALRNSVDSYASNLDGEKAIADTTGTQSFNFTFTQSASSAAVTYRLYGWAEATGGSGGPGDGSGNDIVVEGVVSSAASADLDVRGNGVIITDGDATPTVADHTDFGSVGLNQSNLVRTFTVTNSGSATLTLQNVAVGGVNAGDFTVISQPSLSVAAGATTTFQVRFDPSATGARNATLYLTNNVSGKNPYDFAIRGTGVMAGIARSPSAINVTTMVGSTPAASGFGVTNVGLGRLDYAISTNAAWLTVSPASAQLSEGAGQQHTVAFGVAGLVAGTSNATITISDGNASNSPQTISVSLTLTNIPGPTAQTATADGNELVRLAWTKAPSHDVMIIHRQGSAPTDPSPGVSYSVGGAVGGGTVIYMGSGSALEHVARTNATHYYRFYSINNNHYSPAVQASVSLSAYGTGEIVEPFAYTNGVAVGGLNGGNGWSGAWSVGSGTWSVESTSLTVNTNYPDEFANRVRVADPGNGGQPYATRSFPAVNSGKLYLAAIVGYQYQGPWKFAGFSMMSNTTEKVFAGKIPNSENNRFGLTSSRNATDYTTSGVTLGDFNSSTGNLYLIIGVYDFSTREFKARVYPRTTVIPTTEPGSWDVSRTLAVNHANSIDGIRLASGALGAPDGTIGQTLYDEVRVATSWADLLRIVAEPEIAVLGTNGVVISSGDVTPSVADGSDFGPVYFFGSASRTHTFTITNSGNIALSISGVTTSSTMGADSDFTILSWPAAIEPETASNLVIRFDPGSIGLRTAVVTVANSDADEGSYTFVLAGTGTGAFSTITAQGFEGSSDDGWNYTFNAGASNLYVDGSTNASGDYALTFRGSDNENLDPAVTFDNIDLSGFTAVTLEVAFAVAGADSGDNLHLDLSYDDGATWAGPGSATLVSGASNTNLGFTGIGSTTVSANPWMVSLPATARQVRVRVRFDESVNANTFDRYFIDDIRLTGAGEAPRVSFGAGFYTIDETNTTLTVPVTISSTADATVRVALAGTAAGGGTDFTVNSTNITFSAGGSTTSNIVFTLVNDALGEGPEDIQLRLVGALGAVPADPAIATVVIRDDDAFTVMAANLTAGTNIVDGTYAYDQTAINIIKRLRPDVLAIQEWKITNASYRAFVDDVLGEDYSFYIEPEGDANPIPNGVISRWPIVASNEWTDAFVGARDHVHVEVDLPGPKNLNVVSVHFRAGPTEATARENEARAVTNYIATAGFSAGDYLVIAGDLNVTSRSEAAFLVITQIVTDAHQPKDRNGDLNTNLGRSAPYDHVLPNDLLDAAHLPLVFAGYTYDDGMVFDSEQSGDHLLPVRVSDSYTVNRTHMAIMKLFNLSTAAVPPTVETTIASVTNTTSATAGGDVTNDGGASITNRGVAWSTSINSTVDDDVTSDGTGTGSFSSSLTGLVPGETYYYRAFAQNSAGTSYGTEYSLTTPCFGAPATLVATVTNDTSFTASWGAVSGADGYALDVSTNASFGGGGYATDLIISEYGEGSSNNKWVEIYNGTGASVDLSDYAIWLISNGGSWPESTISLSGTLNHGDAYLIVNSSASSTFTTPADLTTGSLSHNGDDAVGLAKNGVLIDAVGEDGADPGTGWAVAGTANATVDRTLIRKSSITSPNTDWDASRGTDTSSSEWILEAQDYSSDLGIHTMSSGGGPDFVNSYSNRAVAGTSLSVTGLTTGVTYHFRVRATNENCISGNSAVTNVTTTLIAPDIGIFGNGTLITDGDTTPVSTDGTVFGTVGVLGSNSIAVFTITNTGNASLTLENVAVGGTDAGDFTVTAQPSSPVAAGGSTTFTVRFDPTAAGERNAILYVTNNVGSKSPYDFHIRGTGVLAGIDLVPVSFTLTSMVGSPPSARTFTVTNVGLGQLAYTVSTNTPWLTVSPVSGSLDETDGDTLTVSFDVNGWAASTSNGQITVSSAGASNSPQDIAVSVTLTNIPDPTAAAAVADGFELVRLAWTKRPDHDVLIVYRQGMSASAPEQGATYSLGSSLGGGSVIYKGSGSSLEHVVAPDADHYYSFYSINNDHYSPGVTITTNTGNYALGEIVDAFAYTNGVNLSGLAGGQGWTNAWMDDNPGAFTVASGSFATQINYPTNVANRILVTPPNDTGRQAYRYFDGVTSGTIYAGFILNIQYNGPNKYSGMSFMSGATEEMFFGEVYGGDQKLGIGTTVSGTNLFAGTGNDYIVIARYDFGTDVGSVVAYKIGTDSVPVLEPGTWHASFTDNSISRIDGIRLASGAGSGSGTPGNTYFDEVRVAASWSELIGIFPDPEIAVLGTNEALIADGTATASTVEGTDFGSVLVAGGFVDRTLFITNEGAGMLNITGVTTTGTHAADFFVLGYPISVYPGARSNLVIRFDPSAAGPRDATIEIASDDGDEAVYDFAVKGTGQVPPTVTTTIATATNETTASAGGNVTDDGYAAVTNRGVVWSTSAGPTVDDNATSDGTGTGSFSSTLSGLTPGETYYYRAFAQNAAGTSYGTEYTLVAECFGGIVTGLYVSATNDTSFIVAWSNLVGATGYEVDVSLESNFYGTTLYADLIISEYAEGSGNNKYIELYNGTGASIDLSDYALLQFNNGSSTPTYTLALSGTLADGDTYVIENSSESLSVAADLSTSSSVMNFNGDDAIALTNVTAGGYVDIIGQIGTDPGSEWGSGLTSTADNTIRRKSTVTAGDTNGTDAFDPATEWDGYAADTVSDLGSHSASGSGPSFIPGYDARPVAGTAVTVTGLTEGVTYYIRVRGTNDYCVSGVSATSSVTTVTTYPGMDREPSVLSFSATQGDTGTAGSFGVTNVGTGTLFYDIATNAGWIAVSPAAGSVAAGAGQQHTVTYDLGGLNLGVTTAVITITGNGAVTNGPLTVDVSVTVTGINPVVAAALTNDGNEMVRLAWTKDANYDVLIVHNRTNAPSALVQGTAYTVGATVGTDGSRVIYRGTGASLEHVVRPGTVHHYAFYSINNGHYSTPVSLDTTMGVYEVDEVVETFSYTNGVTLASRNGGQGFSGNWLGDTGRFTNILESFASQDYYPTNHGNKVRTTPADATTNIVRRSMGATYNSGVIYVSYILNYQYNGPDKFAGLSLMDSTTERLFVGEVGIADQRLGLDGTSSGKTLTAGTGFDYIIVLRYSWATGTAVANAYRIGVDTVPVTEPVSWDVTLAKASNVVGAVNGIRLASGAGAGTPGDTYFDEIRVSTTWDGLLVIPPSRVVYDWFADSSGAVGGTSGGTGWSNTWTVGGDAFINYVSTSIPKDKSSYHEPDGNKIVLYGDVDDRDMTLARDFLAPYTTGVVYFSWMQNYEFNGSGKYAGMSLMDGTTEKAFVGKVSGGDKTFGIDSSTDNRNALNVLEPGTGNDYVIVARYDFSTRELSASSYRTSDEAIAEEPNGYWQVTTTQSVGHIERLSGIRFAIGAGAAAQVGDVYIDEVRAGTNWFEVVRKDGESQADAMASGPIPKLLYIGKDYNPALNPQGALVDITVTDADLANASEPLDIAVMWTDANGIFLTNLNAAVTNIGSRAGRIDPNWDPAVLSGAELLSIGYDGLFTNFSGYNGANVVTTYVHGAFNITNSTFDDTYFITMSAEDNNLGGGGFAAPNGGDDIPYWRALTVNTALQFFVADDDPTDPEFAEFTINGDGGFGSTNLSAGGIAIIGVNGAPATGGDERFSFVVLSPFPAGTVIKFTDRGWSPGSNTWHRPSEFHTNEWVSLGNASVGEVIELSLDDINNAGDQIVVYQYFGPGEADTDPDNVTFLYAVNLDVDGDGWDEEPIPNDNEHSGIYRGLTNGVTAVSVPLNGYRVNAYYTGTVVGTASELLASISDSNNWYVLPTTVSTTIDITNYNFTVTGAGSFDWTLAALSDEQVLIGGYSVTNIARDEISGLAASNTTFASGPFFEFFNTNGVLAVSNRFEVGFTNGATAFQTMTMLAPSGVYEEITIGTVSSRVYIADMDNDRENDHRESYFSMSVFVYDDDADPPSTGAGLFDLMLGGVSLTPTSGIERLAAWNFNDSDIEVDHGTGSLSTNGLSGVSFGSGTVLNTVTNDAAGSDLTILGSGNIGQSLRIEVDMTGHEGLVLSMAAQRSPAGFNSNDIFYAVNGGAPVLFQPGWVPTTSFSVETFDFSAETALDGATSAVIIITFGTNGVTGTGNNRFDNIQVNASVSRYYEITDAQLTNIGMGSPLQFSFNVYDAESGIARGISYSGMEMTVSVDGFLTNDTASYASSMSSFDTTDPAATSVWAFTSAIGYAERGALYGDGTSNRLISASFGDADNDRPFDNLWSSNQFFGKLRIIDDDPDAPEPLNIAYGGISANNRPFYIATNGITAGSGELIRGNYPRLEGVGTNSVFSLTDEELALAGTLGVEFAFGVRDAGSAILRGNAGTTNDVMSFSIGGVVSGVIAGYQSGMSSTDSGPGVPQTNVWTFTDGFFDDAAINALMANSNSVAVTVPDDDDDRPDDGALLTSAHLGWLRVYDDDVSGPTMGLVDVVESAGGDTILATSFETSQGWPSANYGSSSNWIITDAFGDWVAQGATYTTLNNKNTGTRRLGLLVNTFTNPWIQLPPVDNPGSFSLYAARFTGGDVTIRVERADGASWISVGERVVTNLQDDFFINYAWDVNYDGMDVTLRVVRVGSTGAQVSLDDISINSTPSWISTNVITINWEEGVDDFSALDEYRVVAPAVGAMLPSATNDGAWVSPAVTSVVQSIQGQQGVITGYVFAVDDDHDRAGDRSLGSVVPVIVRVDTNPPPRATGLRATDAANGILLGANIDESSEIKVDWAPPGATEAEAAGWRQSDSVALSPWDSYVITYYEVADENGTPLGGSVTTVLSAASAGWETLLNAHTFTNLVLSNLNFDAYYEIEIQGRDEAGNIGLVTSVIGNTDRFVVTQGVNRVGLDLMVKWKGVEGRDYDVLYVDSATGFNGALSNQWQFMQYTNSPAMYDTGAFARVRPGELTNATYRFYRVAKTDRWQTNRNPRIGSVEIYVTKSLNLYPGENWHSLFFIPDTATVAYVFNTNLLPAADNFAEATKISWFGPSFGGTTNQSGIATAVVWLSSSSTGWVWQVGGSGNANEKLVPPNEGFLIELPPTADPQSLVLIGMLPTQEVVQAVSGGSYASNTIHILGVNLPVRTALTNMGFVGSGFTGNDFGSRADEVRILSPGGSGSLEQPKARLRLRSDQTTWQYYSTPAPGSPGDPRNFIIEPDDAVVIIRRNSGTMMWTNRVHFLPPTKNFTP